jgi:hypothetical protein
MADITHLFLRRHLRSGPTVWTRNSVDGRVRREGVGLSYSFRARGAVISEVPVEDRELSPAWFVREAWPGGGTGLTAGRLDDGERLELTVTSDALVVFSDGGEADRLTAVRGQLVTIGLAAQRLRLVVPG